MLEAGKSVLIVRLEEIKPGMRLAASLKQPGNPRHELLKRGYRLEPGIIPRLREMNVRTVFVDFPGLEDLDRHLAPRLSPERQVIYQKIKRSISDAEGRTRPGVSYEDYYKATRNLITILLTQGKHPIYMDQMSGLGNDEVSHATAVSHLALMIGLRLEGYLVAERKRLPPRHAREVVNLGIAGMLHDIGKCKLPPSLKDFTAAEPPEDPAARREWETHSRLGYDLIHGGVESSAASTVLNHHQHFDGTGFPNSLLSEAGAIVRPSGRGIHIFARILMAADLYERLALLRGSSNKRSNLEVYHAIRTRHANWIDPVVLNALLSIAPPFLPGTMLVLSDNTQAVAVDTRVNEPYVPIVKRMLPDGSGLEEEDVDMHAADAPTIVTAGGIDVKPLMPQPAA